MRPALHPGKIIATSWLFLALGACGEVDAPPGGGEYLPLSSMSTDEAKLLTEGGSAEGMHTHEYLPLTALTEVQAKQLTGGGNVDGLHTHAAAGGEGSRPSPWVECGTIGKITLPIPGSGAGACQMPDFPALKYEYGIAYNSVAEPQVINCTLWNKGVRVYNRHPYFTVADDPSAGMEWGGAMWYKDTLATDDDTCTGTTWRHRYWSFGTAGKIVAGGSNGCYGDTGNLVLKIYCRER